MYRKTCPAYIEDISEIHRTEPYVYSQMVAGKDAPTFGEAKNSWLTGTAAWTFFNISQYILGIQPTLDGLKVDPCIPHTLSGFTVTRRFRGAVYHITVDNAAGVQMMAKSTSPFFTACTAWGVEWFEMRSRMPGYSVWNVRSFSAR